MTDPSSPSHAHASDTGLDQTRSLETELAAFIERARQDLERGVRPSDVANWLHSQGLGTIKLMFTFMKATGVSLRNVKSMGAWWGPSGVSDPDAFDQEAQRYLAEVGRKRA